MECKHKKEINKNPSIYKIEISQIEKAQTNNKGSEQKAIKSFYIFARHWCTKFNLDLDKLNNNILNSLDKIQNLLKSN